MKIYSGVGYLFWECSAKQLGKVHFVHSKNKTIKPLRRCSAHYHIVRELRYRYTVKNATSYQRDITIYRGERGESYTSVRRSNNMHKSELLCLQSSEPIPFQSVECLVNLCEQHRFHGADTWYTCQKATGFIQVFPQGSNHKIFSSTFLLWSIRSNKHIKIILLTIHWVPA